MLRHLIFVVISSTASVAAVNQVSVSPSAQVVSLDGESLNRSHKVVARFFKQDGHPECYRVLFSTFEGNLRVDFVPKHLDHINAAENIRPDDRRLCGKNIGFIIDRHGNVIRRIFVR